MERGDIWVVNGYTWYSDKFIKKIEDLCKKAKENSKDKILADDILNILYSKGKGNKEGSSF